MYSILKKMILANPEVDSMPTVGTLHRRLHNLKAIWNNAHSNDVGIEKLFRLFLASSQFFFLGSYIKHFLGNTVAHKDLAVDMFVLIKVMLPFCMLYFDMLHNPILFGVMLWFMVETLLYVPMLIFASDLLSKPRSYRRSLLLVIFNLVEIILGFAVLYGRCECFNDPMPHWFDPIYFSIVTATTIGYGDYYPISAYGKMIVSFEALTTLGFLVLFLNFLSGRVEQKGYFG